MATTSTNTRGKFVRIRYSPVALQLGDVPVSKLGSCFNWENRKDFPPLESMPWACLDPVSEVAPTLPSTASPVSEKTPKEAPKPADLPAPTITVEIEPMNSPATKSAIPVATEMPVASGMNVAREAVDDQANASTPASEVLEPREKNPTPLDESVPLEAQALPIKSKKSEASHSEVSASEPVIAKKEPSTPVGSDPSENRNNEAQNDHRTVVPAEEERHPYSDSRRDRPAPETMRSSSDSVTSPKVVSAPRVSDPPRAEALPRTPASFTDTGHAKAKQEVPASSAIGTRPLPPIPDAITSFPSQPLIASGAEPNADYLASLERLVLQLNYELGVVTGKADSERWMMQRLIELNLQNLALQEKLRAVTS